MERKTIFVVEDEPMLRVALTRIITSHSDYRVRAFECPYEFLLFLSDGHDPDLVITDNDMPEMSGTELVTHLRVTGFTKPIIMYSGSAEARSDQGLRRLLQAFLPKPSPAEDLMSAIEAALAD